MPCPARLPVLGPSLLHKSASSPLALAFAIYVSGDLRLSYRLPWMWLTPPDGFKQPVPQPNPGSSGRRRGEKCHPWVSLQTAIYSHSSSFSCILCWEHAALSGCSGRPRWSQPSVWYDDGFPQPCREPLGDADRVLQLPPFSQLFNNLYSWAFSLRGSVRIHMIYNVNNIH